MKEGTALRHKIALASRLPRRPAPESPVASDIDAFLPEILFRTHCVARASVPLMRAACARAGELGDRDAVARGLSIYLHAHIEEELAHADWVLQDLELIGRPRADTLARVPPATIAALVGAQYYWIHHCHPVALLAYIAVLEQRVTPLPELAHFMAASRFPAAAFRTLREHAELDPTHVSELYELIDRLPVSAEQAAALSSNAFQTIGLVERAFDEVFA